MKDFLIFSSFVLAGGFIVGTLSKKLSVHSLMVFIGILFIVASIPTILRLRKNIRKEKKERDQFFYNLAMLFAGVFMIGVGSFYLLLKTNN